VAAEAEGVAGARAALEGVPSKRVALEGVAGARVAPEGVAPEALAPSRHIHRRTSPCISFPFGPSVNFADLALHCRIHCQP
jgi:hypothetical protein